MPLTSIRFASSLAIVLALLVVMLGAYTRLTDAGLGCPDWPGCYGHMVLPAAKKALSDAEQQYPHTPIESRKAWTEMTHRYVAGSLACFIVFMAFWVLRLRRRGLYLPWKLPLALVLLVAFQAALGMWTVTLKLLPIVVMAHLLGGILIFSSLCYFRMQLSYPASNAFEQVLSPYRLWVNIGILLVFLQIALGGWVSANYAGVSCIGFPQCNGVWIPGWHFSEGFNLLSPVGANYQGGVLDHEVRATIQWIHRLGAVVVLGYVLSFSLYLIVCTQAGRLRRLAMMALLLVCIQFTLGILNVLYLLPLGIAVAHNAGAALLLATLFMMRYCTVKGAC